jgi:hypothetical protein
MATRRTVESKEGKGNLRRKVKGERLEERGEGRQARGDPAVAGQKEGGERENGKGIRGKASARSWGSRFLCIFVTLCGNGQRREGKGDPAAKAS